MLNYIRRRLHAIIDARIGRAQQMQKPFLPDRGAISDRFHEEVDHLRQAIGEQKAYSRAGRWDGISDPFLFHREAAIGALSEGVAALYGFDIDGIIAEFGTMTGATAKGLARAIESCDNYLSHAVNMYNLPPRQLYLFDSFVGLPESDAGGIDAKSPHVLKEVWSAGTCRGITAEQLAKEIGIHLPEERFKIFAGWFSDTVPQISPDLRFALLHIDSDLYSSAMDILDSLFARRLIARGALVYFDDWNCNRADGAFGERRAWRECVEKYSIDYSDEGSYGIFAKRFTVHSYTGNPEQP
jgi:O-methyltransferase